ncbi:hypothetical protein JYT97_00830 [Haliea sp. AH-315-K21]|nr:hypothetical protein [Haliea sp. AH-315-K21]MBN4075221.1 hypothetical protein [Gammaproteobacteria bacterium AH-315-E17]
MATKKRVLQPQNRENVNKESEHKSDTPRRAAETSPLSKWLRTWGVPQQPENTNQEI